MELKLRLDERTRVVSVPALEAGASARIEIDGQAHEVDLRGARPGELAVVVDGRASVLRVARGPEGVWVGCAGRARLVREAEPDGPRRGPRAAGAGAGTVTPSFPSVVVAVLVQVGDAVRRNQALVVISAMKMEARLVAPHAGTVRAIRAAPGASVKPGDVLVEIEAAKGEAVDG
jgi:biotin carboxyl carrier protein